MSSASSSGSGAGAALGHYWSTRSALDKVYLTIFGLLSVVFVVGLLFAVYLKFVVGYESSSDRRESGATDLAASSRCANGKMFPIAAAGPLGIETKRGQAAMQLIANGSYETLRLYEKGGNCYADILVEGTVDGASYSFNLSPMLLVR